MTGARIKTSPCGCNLIRRGVNGKAKQVPRAKTRVIPGSERVVDPAATEGASRSTRHTSKMDENLTKSDLV